MHSSVSPVRLLLASSSPYRRDLLGRLRLPFEIHGPDVDETPLPGEKPWETALRLAEAKARAAAARHPACVVIGSDQVATLDGRQIGKPGTHERALEQLRSMRGRRVIFHTALCLLDDRADAPVHVQIDEVRTEVTFRNVPDEQLDAYLRIERPYDVAGSAKNEGLGIILIESIVGMDPTALTGLPLIALTTMLGNAGVRLLEEAGA